MLARLVYCARCGQSMQASPRNGRRRYACVRGAGAENHCGGTFIVAEGLEAYVRDQVVGQLLVETDFLGREGPAPVDAAEIAERIEASQARLHELALAFADGEMTRETWDVTRAQLGAQIEADTRASGAPHRGALRDLAPAGLAAGGSAAWEALDVTRQAAICRYVIKRVLIGPGTTPGRREFDYARVSIEGIGWAGRGEASVEALAWEWGIARPGAAL